MLIRPTGSHKFLSRFFEYHYAESSVDGPFVFGARSKFTLVEEPNTNPTMEEATRRMSETSESAELSFPDPAVTPLNTLEQYSFASGVVSIGMECLAPLAMNLNLMISFEKHDTDRPAPSDLEHASVLRCKNHVALESPF